MTDVEIRSARAEDVDAIHAMIVELAEYEREPDAVTGTPAQLRDALFGARPAAEAIVADADGDLLAFALFHPTFSTWDCAPGLWLEDLYVRERYRHLGLGESLLRALATIALARGYTRLGWVALDWNEPALRFYEKHGAEVLREWLVHRVSGDALTQLAVNVEGPRRSGALP